MAIIHFNEITHQMGAYLFASFCFQEQYPNIAPDECFLLNHLCEIDHLMCVRVCFLEVIGMSSF